MEKFFTINSVDHLGLVLPEDAILSRLGRNRYLSVMDQELSVKLRLAMQKAFARLRPRGRWKLLRIVCKNTGEVVLDDLWKIKSRKFAEFVQSADYLYLSAVTIGSELPQAMEQAQSAGNMFEAAVFDAVGSECADLAIELLQKIAAAELLRNGWLLSQRRFSAGYGGVELFHQQEIFKQLDLEDMQMSLTESFIIQPEKSVTAFAVVNKYMEQ
ncbi:MAG: hypothetical protein IKA65_04275 [Lentisphaeria bacterium]|nr:hypothetical protein [Lentisphaeria bacterium]